jgi:hypothetical protein
MTLPSLVPKVEKCIEMRDAGFKRETMFYWCIQMIKIQDRELVSHEMAFDAGDLQLEGTVCQDEQFEPSESLLSYDEAIQQYTPDDMIAAPLTDEILAVLPKYKMWNDKFYSWEMGCEKLCNFTTSKREQIFPSWLPLPDLWLKLKKEGLI